MLHSIIIRPEQLNFPCVEIDLIVNFRQWKFDVLDLVEGPLEYKSLLGRRTGV